MSINAEKCLSNGSNPGLGFKVNKADRTFYVDEEEAAIVREIFERYASGETKAKIVKDLQRRKVKTSIGNEFTYNSLSRLLKNKRYIGIYLYKGVETPGGMPRILDDDLFYRVQSLMNKNKSAPARTRGENEYLLTTKLFCGHYKEMMVGYGGTGKSGKQYHYYMCKKKCDKKIIGKQYIEDRVVSECLKMLTDDKIRYIAKRVAEECNKSPDNISVREIKKAIKEVDAAIENLWKGIEQGQSVDMLTEHLHKRQAEKEELETQLAIENNKKICLSEAQILGFLDYVCEMPFDDFNILGVPNTQVAMQEMSGYTITLSRQCVVHPDYAKKDYTYYQFPSEGEDAAVLVVGLPLKSLLFDDTIPVDVHVEIPSHGVNAALSGTLKAGVNSLSAPVSVISDSDIDSIVQLRERLEQFADLINTALKRVQ